MTDILKALEQAAEAEHDRLRRQPAMSAMSPSFVTGTIANVIRAAQQAQGAAGGMGLCWCLTCRPYSLDGSANRIALCPICGNKRCPHANDHRIGCTHSNDPGQPGSAYQPTPSPQPAQPVHRTNIVTRLLEEAGRWAFAEKPENADNVSARITLNVCHDAAAYIQRLEHQLAAQSQGAGELSAHARRFLESYKHADTPNASAAREALLCIAQQAARIAELEGDVQRLHDAHVTAVYGDEKTGEGGMINVTAERDTAQAELERLREFVGRMAHRFFTTPNRTRFAHVVDGHFASVAEYMGSVKSAGGSNGTASLSTEKSK